MKTFNYIKSYIYTRIANDYEKIYFIIYCIPYYFFYYTIHNCYTGTIIIINIISCISYTVIFVYMLECFFVLFAFSFYVFVLDFIGL